MSMDGAVAYLANTHTDRSIHRALTRTGPSADRRKDESKSHIHAHTRKPAVRTYE
jgi:hypothetical protein